MRINRIFILVFFITAYQFSYSQTQEEMRAYDDYVQAKKDNASNKYTYSQFAVALRYRDEIGLNELQVYALYREVATLKNMKNAHYQEHHEGLDTREHESSTMTAILTDDQYTKTLEFKNERKVKSIIDKDIKEMTLRGVLEGEDLEQVKLDLYNYYIVRESLYDRYRHDLIRQSDETRQHYYDRPAILKKLTKARRAPNNNTLGQGFNGKN